MASQKGPRKVRDRMRGTPETKWDEPGRTSRALTGPPPPDRNITLPPRAATSLDAAVAPSDGFVTETAGMRRSQGRVSLQQLDAFYDRSLITEVEGIIKIGKEASAYRCRASQELGGGLVVAKVYRSRQYRFKNDAVYLEGRERMLRGQVLRAVKGKSSFGREIGTALWVNSEWTTMQVLHAAGADVPKPLALEADAVLMEYFGDEDDAAPQLNRVRLDLDEAQRAFKSVMRNVELMLKLNLVHGDLSSHNILWWQGRAVIIDFPQAVDPRFNNSAQEFLRRDLGNVCDYFARQGIEADSFELADGLWRRFTLGEL
jgi:RIO kinase 1